MQILNKDTRYVARPNFSTQTCFRKARLVIYIKGHSSVNSSSSYQLQCFLRFRLIVLHNFFKTLKVLKRKPLGGLDLLIHCLIRNARPDPGIYRRDEGGHAIEIWLQLMEELCCIHQRHGTRRDRMFELPNPLSQHVLSSLPLNHSSPKLFKFLEFF